MLDFLPKFLKKRHVCKERYEQSENIERTGLQANCLRPIGVKVLPSLDLGLPALFLPLSI